MWRVGNGALVSFVEDRWVGSGRAFKLPAHMVEFLRDNGFFNLSQIVDLVTSNPWGQGWSLGEILGFRGECFVAWRGYITRLKRSHVRLQERPKELIWVNSPLGVYSHKVWYNHLSSEA